MCGDAWHPHRSFVTEGLLLFLFYGKEKPGLKEFADYTKSHS